MILGHETGGLEKRWNQRDLKVIYILEDLNNLTDVSDPDCSHPNLYHAIQTAEMIKKDGHPEWMQLIGLLTILINTKKWLLKVLD